jgi:hypothetical protein
VMDSVTAEMERMSMRRNVVSIAFSNNYVPSSTSD